MIFNTIKSYFAFICEIQSLRLFFGLYHQVLSRLKKLLEVYPIRGVKLERARRTSSLSKRRECEKCEAENSFQLVAKTFGGNQKGQAIVEYVLLLVIILSLFYGLSKTFFEPLQKYGTSVFTNTIACSFEYGQLPAEIISEDGCEARYEGGRLSNSSNSRQRNQASSSKKSDSGKGDEKTQTTPATTSSSSDDSGRGRSTTLYSRGNPVQLGRPFGAESRAITSNQSYAETAGMRIDISDSDYLGRRGRRPILKPITGELETIILDQKKKKLGEITRSVASTLDGTERKIKKITVNAKKSMNAQDEAQKPWDFYFLLRIALIILMVVAILLFVFFQVSQIRRGSS